MKTAIQQPTDAEIREALDELYSDSAFKATEDALRQCYLAEATDVMGDIAEGVSRASEDGESVLINNNQINHYEYT
jgi:hypothetical protein